MPQSLSVVYLHLIFSTKERRPFLRDKPQRFSVSHSRLESVLRYIREQEQHHLKMTFQDELRALLRKHEVQWDERYLWD
jgi:hypothetical protein